MRTPAASCDGFTLLELLVALAIFGLLAAMSYSGLQAVLQQQSYTEEAATRLGELQKMYHDYKDVAEFCLVYINEAHAADGSWPVGTLP